MRYSRIARHVVVLCIGCLPSSDGLGKIPLDVNGWGYPQDVIASERFEEPAQPTWPVTSRTAGQGPLGEPAWPSGENVGCAGCVDGCFACGGRQRRFRLTEFNAYSTFSYLEDLAGSYNEFEFASQTELGRWEMENRTTINVSDLPGTIALGPTNPFGEGNQTVGRAQGFGDVLSGFFFSRKPAPHDWHLGIGPVFTFPSATSDILGSGQWTVGPGAHFSTEIGKLETGFFIWQAWTYAGDDSREEVNQLFGKPFFVYELNEKWDLIYIPLGLSYAWKHSGSKATVPVGGGLRRLFTIHGRKMGFQVQLFDYVARKSKDPEYELRMTVEFMLDE